MTGCVEVLRPRPYGISLAVEEVVVGGLEAAGDRHLEALDAWEVLARHIFVLPSIREPLSVVSVRTLVDRFLSSRLHLALRCSVLLIPCILQTLSTPAVPSIDCRLSL